MDSSVFIFNSDNKIMKLKKSRVYKKRSVDEGHIGRIELYTQRYALAQDIFTGDPLNETDAKQREEVELLKAKCDAGKTLKGVHLGKARGLAV